MAELTSSTGLMSLMIRRWWVLVLGVAVGAGLALAALQIVSPTYTATATQLIKGVPGSGTGAPYLAAQFAVARARSYPALIYSSSVLDSVRSDLGQEFTDARLRDQLSASNPTDTPLVLVTATGGTPEEAQSLANSASRHLARFITQIETVSGTTPVIVETAVQAGLPTSPSSPQPTLFLALGLTGGFALGAIAVVAWGAVDERRRSGRLRRAHAPETPAEASSTELRKTISPPVEASAQEEAGAQATVSDPAPHADDAGAVAGESATGDASEGSGHKADGLQASKAERLTEQLS